MKFAKELEEDLVPEWRAKYLDYKLAKKKLKAVARAYHNLEASPKTPGRRRPANLFQSAAYQLPIPRHSPFEDPLTDTTWSSSHKPSEPRDTASNGKTAVGSSQGGVGSSTMVPDGSTYYDGTPRVKDFAQSPGSSDDAFSPWDSGAVTNYGSIIASPRQFGAIGPPALELPDPALSPSVDSFPRHNRAWRQSKPPNNATPLLKKIADAAADAYSVGSAQAPSKLASTVSKPRRFFSERRAMSTPDPNSFVQRSPFLRRVMSVAGSDSPQTQSSDLPLEVYRDFDEQRDKFLEFLDSELEKIESFYKMKENEATERLKLLKEQLHEMRDRRITEVQEALRAQEAAEREHRRERARLAEVGVQNGHPEQHSNGSHDKPQAQLKWMKPIEHALGVGKSHFRKNTKALEQMGPSGPHLLPGPGQKHDSWRDFTRRTHAQDDVPYRVAKRKLKLALQEFYRGLELLKSYALLNRTAFRKINKKYDKAVRARPTGRYMSEKVNKAWFVQSEVLDGHIVSVEDLYARYFEGGNHKIAVGKLRSKHTRDESYNSSVFRNGLLLSAGLVLAIQGLVTATELLNNPNPVVSDNTSYLLQLYAGYFLGLFLFLFFCFDCEIWSRAKINYVFIFEFDTRHNLDWRQLAELPCFFFFLLGLCIWLNFYVNTVSSMFLYWPVVLVGLTVLILFFPGPILYHRSREWWAYSNFRLLLAGIYPVEFRDFFLGDMYCSLTYAMGNLELFFCLYVRGWDNPTQCNSTHSRLLGFFSTVPGIWRALQCLRRYYDTRNAFPHLVNCGKYLFTILFYMSLSLYRINEVPHLKVLFIFFATVNSLYTSLWDVVMDWSLGNPYAKHPFLREMLGYKRPHYYYMAMVLDPILRFNWIFYALFASELQHSALLSFLVALTEICRRGIWTLFRVENEHCTNVGRFRASRDVPLPYEIPPLLDVIGELSQETSPTTEGPPGEPSLHESTRPHASSGADLESGSSIAPYPSSGSLRRRKPLPPSPAGSTPMQRGLQRMGSIVALAHTQDFERKRRPDIVDKDSDDAEDGRSTDDEDDEEGIHREPGMDRGVQADVQRELAEVERIQSRHGHKSSSESRRNI